nr:hypothetical protein GCM10020093_101820 [Planobispora longispora]
MSLAIDRQASARLVHSQDAAPGGLANAAPGGLTGCRTRRGRPAPSGRAGFVHRIPSAVAVRLPVRVPARLRAARRPARGVGALAGLARGLRRELVRAVGGLGEVETVTRRTRVCPQGGALKRCATTWT